MSSTQTNPIMTTANFIGAEAGHGRHPSFSLFFRLYATAKWTLLWLPRFWKARGELAQLAAMSECERRDIGLTAFDVENALTLPVDRDPTEALAHIVDDRRHRREC